MQISTVFLLSIALAQTAQFNLSSYVNTVGAGYGCYGINGVAPTRLVAIVALSPKTAVQFYSDYGCKIAVDPKIDPQHTVGPVPKQVSETNVYSVQLISF